MTFRFDERLVPILQRFNLEHLARLGTMRIDRDLITALVERWRLETHTFHLPTGEIAPTLQDISCLWGLPISGRSIAARTDENWEYKVIQCFGHCAYETFRRPMGTFHMRMAWLREEWLDEEVDEDEHVEVELHAGADEATLIRYARAYLLDLCSSVMFPDHSGYLGAMFLQLLTNVENPAPWSWGTAVLAYLYQGLCDAAERDAAEIAAPCMFLQMWAWTRFPIGRPRPLFNANGLAGRPFGSIWVGGRDYLDEPHRSVTLYRRRFEELRDEEVNWEPYRDIMHQLPPICQQQREMDLWFYQGPLIWFWVVEYYSPERVMRQFGRYQMVPPPFRLHPPLHCVRHEPNTNHNWRRVHAFHIKRWQQRRFRIVPHAQAFDPAGWDAYMAWFNREGMRTIWRRPSTASGMLDPAPPPPTGNPINQSFVMAGERVQQTVSFQLFYRFEIIICIIFYVNVVYL